MNLMMTSERKWPRQSEAQHSINYFISFRYLNSIQ